MTPANSSAPAVARESARTEPLLRRVARACYPRYHHRPYTDMGCEEISRKAHLLELHGDLTALANRLAQHGMPESQAADLVTRYMLSLIPGSQRDLTHEFLRWVRERSCYDLDLDRLPRRERGDER